MQTRELGDIGAYERRPLAFEMPAALTLLALAGIAYGETVVAVSAQAEAAFGALPYPTAVALLKLGALAAQFGMPALAAAWYVRIRGIDVSAALPGRRDRRRVATAVGVPAVLVGGWTVYAVTVGDASALGDVASTGDALFRAFEAVVAAGAMALLYHGALQGTFARVTDGDRGLASTVGLVVPLVLLELVAFTPAVGFASLAGNAAVAAGTFCVAAWAADRTGTLVAPAIAYLSLQLTGLLAAVAVGAV